MEIKISKLFKFSFKFASCFVLNDKFLFTFYMPKFLQQKYKNLYNNTKYCYTNFAGKLSLTSYKVEIYFVYSFNLIILKYSKAKKK